MNKLRLDEIINAKREKFIAVSDKIWDYAETRFQEKKSAEILCEALVEEGFSVAKSIGNIDTAFVGSYGNTGPVIAILGEYDALSGLSQVGRSAKKEAVKPGGNGHGCGHNLLGAGALAAAVAVKQYLIENGLPGTIRYYGCPGEEGGSGKTFMVREGLFKDVDIALTWHPMTHNAIFSVRTLANYQVYYKFFGKSSHAAKSPHLGRSALDAVELMNVGVNYLREHIVSDARVHYAITNSGGSSPNVVQPVAEVLYLIRAPKITQVQDIFERVCNIARGAALMTDTKCDIVFDKACSDYLPNKALEELLYTNFVEVGAPVITDQDKQFAHAIHATLSDADLADDMQQAIDYMAGKGQQIVESLQNKMIADTILPYVHLSSTLAGSTDVGDVSWVVPTAQLIVACNALGTPGHSWQTVAQGTSDLAHKGMLVAGRVMARTVIDVLANPKIIEEAKNELQQALSKSAYTCPIPPDVKPSPIK